MKNKLPMKTYISTLILLVFSSCISTKSTIKNIDTTAVKPFFSNGMFLITTYAKESKYGIDPDYPVNVGIISPNYEDTTVGYYFNGLTGPNDEAIVYNKIETCCPFPSKNSQMGAGMLSVYEVYFKGNDQKMKFYFNAYEKGEMSCPRGFKIKKITN